MKFFNILHNCPSSLNIIVKFLGIGLFGIIFLKTIIDFLKYENDDCFEAVTTNCDNNASSSSSSSTDDGTCPAIKCLADNGSEKGGPLCCGQSGVLQNTKYNCPADYPFCVGYKCGESWGTCQATAS